ncbi:MAG: ribonucleoside-diphosphate reductase subunit alpha [Candidatus Moraniibacteriota bacterium]|nr:MAG: ribonucleoside-diphosphate reductase subunit alpha [Candidatus Moranbacteria bacterium]
MTITHIQKRDGEIEDFDRARIEEAIQKACDAIGEKDQEFIPFLVDEIVEELERHCENEIHSSIPVVEKIQDAVERALMRVEYFEVAKAYILYREEHRREREERKEYLISQFEKKSLKVIKNNKSKELFDIKKIKKVFDRASKGYEKQCLFKELVEAFKNNIVEDIKTSDINKLLVKTCIDLVSVENIAWQYVGARIFLGNLYKQALSNRKLSMEKLYSAQSYKSLFDDYIQQGLYYKDFYQYYSKEDILEAGRYLNKNTDENYEYTTILSLANRYLLNPNKIVKELPQEMYMSVALFLAIPEKKENRLKFALRLYEECSEQRISLPTPTLLNARTNYHQLSSCFKINIDDDLRAIYHGIENMAQISKFGGGIGVYLGHIRSRGAMIRKVEGTSGGVNPWIKVINDTANAVNQLGARAGAISVTLDIWHADIYDFLDLQTETGDIRSKAFDIFPAVSIPDIFMKRLKDEGEWTLFDPHEVGSVWGKKLEDHFGKEFEKFYKELEADNRLKLKKTVLAKDLFKKFLKATVETGMPYVFYRDTVNRLNPNKHAGNIYSTQLCTEICQNTSPTVFKKEVLEESGEIIIRYQPGDLVVCNLASVNVAKVYTESVMKKTFPILLRVLDNVITLNYYPIKEAERTALRYRSIGIGYLGLAEYLATRKLAYESLEARVQVDQLFERYAYYTYRSSINLAKERGSYELYKGSEYSKGILLGHKSSWFEENTKYAEQWKRIFLDMKEYGVRFGYHTAPAPNTSTAGVVGTTAALLPIYKKYFIETNLSSSTIRVAPKLNKENFWYYREYITMDMADVIDMIAIVYKWIDQSISFEWMIDPARTSPAQLFGYYMKAWEDGIKTVYYVRSLSGEIKDDCVSCSG